MACQTFKVSFCQLYGACDALIMHMICTCIYIILYVSLNATFGSSSLHLLTFILGPEPLCDDSNVVVSFFALGDSPYDKNTNSCFNEQLNRFENPCSKNYGCNGGSGTQSETW